MPDDILKKITLDDGDSGYYTAQDVAKGDNEDGFRMQGIEAPEVYHDADGQRANEYLGLESSALLQDMVGDQAVEVRSTGETGYYGRDIVELILADGTNLNEQMVASGRVHQSGEQYNDAAKGADLALFTSAGDVIGNPVLDETQQLIDEAAAHRDANGGITGSLSRYGDNQYQGGDFSRSLRRGTDQTQMMYYGFANAVGRATGIDILAEWGEQGIERNIREAARNPAQIQSWDDVDDLDAFYTFMVESLGEQAPQLLGDALAFLSGGGVGGIAARRGMAKKLKRELGEEGYGTWLASRSGQEISSQTFAEGFARGGKGAAFGSMYAQSAGETQVELLDADVDAATTALLTGLPKAALEYVSLAGILGRAKKSLGVTPQKFGELMGSVATQVGLASLSEGTTEMLQTIADKVAVKLETGQDPLSYSKAEWDEIVFSGAKGAAVGGGISAIGGAAKTAKYGAGKLASAAPTTTPDPAVVDTEPAGPGVDPAGPTAEQAAPAADPNATTADPVAQAADPNGATPDPEAQAQQARQETEEALHAIYEDYAAQQASTGDGNTQIQYIKNGERVLIDQRPENYPAKAPDHPGQGIPMKDLPARNTTREADPSEPTPQEASYERAQQANEDDRNNRVAGGFAGGVYREIGDPQGGNFLVTEGSTELHREKTKRRIHKNSRWLVDLQANNEVELLNEIAKLAQQGHMDAARFMDELTDTVNALKAEGNTSVKMAGLVVNQAAAEVGELGDAAAGSVMDVTDDADTGQNSGIDERDALDVDEYETGLGIFDQNAQDTEDFDASVESRRAGEPVKKARATVQAKANTQAFPTYQFEVVDSGQTWASRKEQQAAIREHRAAKSIKLYHVRARKRHWKTKTQARNAAEKLTKLHPNSDFRVVRNPGTKLFELLHERPDRSLRTEVFDESWVYLRGFAKAVDNAIAAGNTGGVQTQKIIRLIRYDMDPDTGEMVNIEKVQVSAPSLTTDMGRFLVPDGDLKSRPEQMLAQFSAAYNLLGDMGWSIDMANERFWDIWFMPTKDPVTLGDLLMERAQATSQSKALDVIDAGIVTLEHEREMLTAEADALWAALPKEPFAEYIQLKSYLEDARAQHRMSMAMNELLRNRRSRHRLAVTTNMRYHGKGLLTVARGMEKRAAEQKKRIKEARIRIWRLKNAGKAWSRKQTPEVRKQFNAAIEADNDVARHDKELAKSYKARKDVRVEYNKTTGREDKDGTFDPASITTYEGEGLEHMNPDPPGSEASTNTEGTSTDSPLDEDSRIKFKNKIEALERGIADLTTEKNQQIEDHRATKASTKLANQQIMKMRRELHSVREEKRDAEKKARKAAKQQSSTPRMSRNAPDSVLNAPKILVDFMVRVLSAMKLANQHRLHFIDYDLFETDAAYADKARSELLDAGLSAQDVDYLTQSRVKGVNISEKAGGADTIHIIMSVHFTPIEQLMILAHELGHSAYRQVLGEATASAGFNKLRAEFLREREKFQGREWVNHQWNYTNEQAAFEEWFADKFAAWAMNKSVERKAPTTAAEFYFKKIADKLRVLYRQVKQEAARWLTERITRNEVFDLTWNTFLASAPANNFIRQDMVDKARTEEEESWRFIVHPMARAVAAPVNGLLRTRFMRQAARIGKGTLGILSPLMDADNQLRQMGYTTLADHFYQQSSSIVRSIRTRVGQPFSFFRAMHDQRALWATRLDTLVKEHGEADIIAALKRMQGFGEDSQIDYAAESPAVQAIHAFLNSFYDYSKTRMPTLGRLPHYMATYYNTDEISNRPAEFLQILLDTEGATPNVTEQSRMASAQAIMRRILQEEDADHSMDDLFRAQKPGMRASHKRLLTKEATRTALRDAGFYLEPDGEANMLGAYLHTGVRRAEFENIFGDYSELHLRGNRRDGGTGPDSFEHLKEIAGKFNIPLSLPDITSFQALEDKLVDHGWLRVEHDDDGNRELSWYSPTQKLDTMVKRGTAQEQARAKTIVKGYMGQLGQDVDPTVREAAGWIIVAQNYLTLLFSAVASIPDFAGTLVRTREMGAAIKAAKTQFRSVANKDARERARLMGLILHKVTHQSINEYYGQSFYNEKQAKASEVLFKWNLQEALTNATRVGAMAVGEDFLVTHARKASEGNARSQKYIDQLNIDADTVTAWDAAGRPIDEDNTAMLNAINQFVDESVVRPNAAMRPVWASSGEPHYMLLWHLKSFLYAYGKVVMGGVAREMVSRHRDAEGKFATIEPAAILALTVMPLAALALEARWAIQYEDEDEYPREDGFMYVAELMDRGGMLGPMSLAYGAATGYGDVDARAAHMAGPAAGHFFTLIDGERSVEDKLKRSLPVFAQVPRFWDFVAK